MEGFLQSLKFKSKSKQARVCLLSGVDAKKSTRHTLAQLRWKLTHTLYWQGKPIDRFSGEYQELLDKAYKELSYNMNFQKAIKSSSASTLIHTIGKTDARKTVLTEYEFISRLQAIRDVLIDKAVYK